MRNKNHLTPTLLISLISWISLVPSISQASELGLGLSNHTAQFSYSSPFDPRSFTEASAVYHEDEGEMFALGFYSNDKYSRYNITAMVGGKLFWINVDGPDGQGMAIGGKLAWQPLTHLLVEGSFHYSPSVVSFKDVEHFRHWNLKVGFKVMSNANVFVAYRDIDIDVEGVTIVQDEGWRNVHDDLTTAFNCDDGTASTLMNPWFQWVVANQLAHLEFAELDSRLL